MDNINRVAQDIIERVRNLQEFEVSRDIEDIPFSGQFPYSISHKQGHPAKIKVHALTQQEAENLVDHWLRATS